MSWFRSGCWLALIAVVWIAAPVFAVDPMRPIFSGGRCNSCLEPAYSVCRGWCQSKYKPPVIHPYTTFGYYPTMWSPWPSPGWSGTPVLHQPVNDFSQPPLGPTGPEIERLPPPRLPQGRINRNNLPIINPAGYHGKTP